MAARLCVVFEVLNRVVEGQSVARQEFVRLGASLKAQHPAHLSAVEGACAVALDRQRFDRVPGHVAPLRLEAALDIVWELDFYFHGGMVSHWHRTVAEGVATV